MHLEYIHLQILSVVSSAQLSGVFQRRSNFDLSRLLEGQSASHRDGGFDGTGNRNGKLPP